MDDLKKQVQDLNENDWSAFIIWVVGVERERRETLPIIEKARVEDTQKLWEARPELKPEFKTDPVEVKPSTQGAVTKADLVKSYPAWKQPTGAHDALPTGALVAHKGEVWRTDLPTLNVWEPEEGNVHTRWVKVTDELLFELNDAAEPEDTPADDEATGGVEDEGPTAPEYKQPTRAHDAYNIGDRVTYKGDVYESAINNNVWSPEVHAPGWKKL